MADPREFLIGIAVLLGAILVLYFTGLLLVAVAGMILFMGILCVVQVIPQLKGLPGLVVGSVLVAIALAIFWAVH
jgi:hypothetical protein